MHSSCRGVILFGLLFAGLSSIPGICTAQAPIITDFRLTLSAEYINGTGRVHATARWNAEAPGVLFFDLAHEGRIFAGSGRRQGRMSASGDAKFFLCSYEEFQTLKEEYFSKPQTFTLLAVYNMGNRESCFSYTYEPADILRIENCIAGYSDMQRGVLEIDHHPDANEGPDAYDAVHNTMHLPAMGAVTSVQIDPNAGSIRRLALDARPKGSVSEFDIELSLESDTGAPVRFTKDAANELHLSLPRMSNGYDFRPGPLTLQQYDPSDPDAQYPLYDVRRVVASCDGLMWLPPLRGSYESGAPYACFRLSFTRKASGDLRDDGAFNLRDFAVLAKNWRSAAKPTVADMGGARGLGVPDGNVDGLDLKLFSRKWAGDTDGFESGGFDSLGWYGEGDVYWRIASDESRSGAYCAQAGRIEDDQRSRLAITIECRQGEVRFWRKVSSQYRCDFLRFRSGNTVLGEWSGELDWEQVSFPVTPGRRTFSWEYSKNSGGWMGSDTAWIDLVSFPTGELESERK